MNIKNQGDFRNAYLLCQNLVEGKFGHKKIVGEGESAKMEFVPIIAKDSALAYAAKRFSEKNFEHLKKMEQSINDLGYELCMEDEKTKEILYRSEADKSPHQLRFTKENQKSYEKRLDAIYSKDIDFEVKTHICPPHKLPAEIPTEFYLLNGLILNHKFYDEFEEGEIVAEIIEKNQESATT